MRKEIKVQVSDFGHTVELLKEVGFNATPVIKKHRRYFTLGNIRLKLDDMKIIPPFLEIQAATLYDMYEACQKLGLDFTQAKKQGVKEIYKDQLA